jgi:hypothetical protein
LLITTNLKSVVLVLALVPAPDILAGIMTTTFDLEPDVADHLEKLCQITNLGSSELINLLLESPLRQTIGDGDTDLLQYCIQSSTYRDKEDALSIIARYESFVSELKYAGDTCYHPDAKPKRTREGDWEILFKSTHPWDAEEAIYQ